MCSSYKDQFQIIFFCFLSELNIIFSDSCWQSWLFILFDEWLHSYSNFPIFWQRLWHIELSDNVYLSVVFSDNACDISAIYKGAILYQSTVVSIETKKNNANIIQMCLLCLQNKEIYQEPKKRHWEHETRLRSKVISLGFSPLSNFLWSWVTRVLML